MVIRKKKKKKKKKKKSSVFSFHQNLCFLERDGSRRNYKGQRKFCDNNKNPSYNDMIIFYLEETKPKNPRNNQS